MDKLIAKCRLGLLTGKDKFTINNYYGMTVKQFEFMFN